MENPKDITYKAIYIPDMEKMVQALRIVHESTVDPDKTKKKKDPK